MKNLLIMLTVMLSIIAVGNCAEEWDKDVPLDADAKIDFPTDNQANNEAIDRLLSNYREGMKLTYSSASTIVVSAGEVVCSNSTGTTRKFRKNTSSTNVTFANIDTGAEANDTYYIYAVADADATTATFKISLSSSAPSSTTYYKRLGSFVNSGGDMEQVANDNENIIVATGTAAHGATISVPSGYSQDECAWTVSYYGGSATSHAINDLDISASSSRVVTCRVQDNNWVDGSTSSWENKTCNYSITCHR